ncbi:unnamed protein product [Phaedon cochleariae]|uniref:THAP-type domain-containing protein n=1 Tax=Phaedon cochleariae TaxID=80249 RepID=A0A9N9WXA9_PHACE|nr:unnamed protein product [Phaedon cochleariae]
MVMKCFVCSAEWNRNSFRTFHRIPKDSEKRRRWAEFLGLTDNYTNMDIVRVCSAHFPVDDFIMKPGGKRCLKYTALPILGGGQSLNDFPDMQERQLENITELMEPSQKKIKRHCLNLRAWSINPSHTSSSTMTASGSLILSHSETDDDKKQPDTKDVTSQTTFIWKDWKSLKAENKQLKEENSKLRKKVKELENNKAGENMNNFVESLKLNEKKCKFYTSLTFTNILALFSFLQPIESLQYWGCKNSDVDRPLRKKCNALEELIIVLIRLRTGLLIEDIHYRFNISVGLVTKLFTSWIQHIYCRFNVLRPMMFPSRTLIQQHLPSEFKKLKNIRVIIDCTEFYCQTPSNFEHQSNLYSSYKAHTTFKVLIGCTPNGAISFVSDLFEGSISDKELVKKSNLMDLLEEGDLVLADRGFNIEDLTIKKKVALNIPPFLKGRDKLTAQEEIETKQIAKKRIYVEHVVGRIKSFRLLKRNLSLSMRGILSQMVFVTACLVNFQEPILNGGNTN